MSEKDFSSQAYADGLRRLAAMVEADPRLAGWLRYTPIESVHIPVGHHEDPKAALATFTRAALKADADEIEKEYSSNFAGVTISFGPVGIHVYAKREEVCELVELDEEETVEVTDPEYVAPVPPKVTVTRKRTEWKCSPLLEGRAS